MKIGCVQHDCAKCRKFGWRDERVLRPAEREDVLVRYSPRGLRESTTRIARLVDGVWTFRGSGRLRTLAPGAAITHWMPMPEAP